MSRTVDREEIINLLSRLSCKEDAEQLRTASALAWIGIQARNRNGAVRGSLGAAAQGRVDAAHFLPLLGCFSSLPMPIRREVALALGDLAGSVAVTELARLAKVPDTEARLIAVDALGKIGGPRAVAELKAASGDVDEAVRAEAVRSLGWLAAAEAKREAGALEGASVKTHLLDVRASDPSQYVREVAAEALAAIRRAEPPETPPERIPAPAVPVSA